MVGGVGGVGVLQTLNMTFVEPDHHIPSLNEDLNVSGVILPLCFAKINPAFANTLAEAGEVAGYCQQIQCHS